MSTGIEISIIRSMVKSFKPSSTNKNKNVSHKKNTLDSMNKTDTIADFQQKNDISKEIAAYNIDGTIERIASENKNLVDIFG